MSRARMKTASLHFSNNLPGFVFLIAVAVGKPGFCEISTFLVTDCSCVHVSTCMKLIVRATSALGYWLGLEWSYIALLAMLFWFLWPCFLLPTLKSQQE